MKLAEIIAEARIRASDQAPPYLVDDSTWAGWAADAEAEAAMRASLLYDDTAPFCQLTLVDGQDAYPLDARIWRVDTVWLQCAGSTRERGLALTGIDRLRPGDECDTFTSRPLRAAHQGGMLRVWPKPTTNTLGTLNLRVYRLPLKRMADPDNDSPEIDPIQHIGLVDWMVYRACSQKDGELYDATHAEQALADFEARFGDRPSADVMRKHNERRQNTTNYGGY